MVLIVSASPSLILIIIFIIVLIIVFINYFFGKKQVIIRTLSKIPHKPIHSFKTNEIVKVTGKALHVDTPLIAPLSKRKCIFYYVRIEQKKSNGKNSYWKTLVTDEKIQNFFLSDNDHMLIVQPTHNPLNFVSYLQIDKKTKSGTFNDPTPEFESVLKSYNINPNGLFGFNKRLRYKEGIIEIGEEITVAGQVRWKTLNEPIPEYPYSKIASIENPENKKIIITDLPEVKSKERF